jgi:hypothetical protein
MHVMAPELISTAYFINPSHQSVCLYVYPSTFARQGLSKNVTAATNTRNNRIFGRIIFCVVHISKESRQLVLPRTSCLLFDRNSGPSHIENVFCTLSSSVSIVTGYWLDAWGSIPSRGKRFFPTQCPGWPWGPPSFLYSGYQG